MKKIASIAAITAGLFFSQASAFGQQLFYPSLALTCTSSPVFQVDVYGNYNKSTTPGFSSGIALHYYSPASTIFSPLSGPAGETYQLVELTIGIGGSSDATFSGTELFGTAKPLGTSGRTAYVYLANPGKYEFYIY
ncbi:hypothetical protein [Taibaiella chishuiensis]|uniref:Uncharacterized protein n=1 Tax=Taibaiella chishuiensis TaxID=1434707 RepID=A0A2P8D0Q0_9BACT|nr:hypothetical protein [Taibaiella chishuiensis]PSK90746.1 hypothetical protein B0I18_107156 [Taibaiella chishuiensis]